MEDQIERVSLGTISGVFGLQGWLKVYSDTEPRIGIISYKQWWVKGNGEWQSYKLKKGKAHGKGVIVKLDGVDDRNAAELLLGRTIAVTLDQLPELSNDEYYWRDLIGMEVVTNVGVELGVVTSLFATGANDVVVVKGERERLIPWVRDQVILSVSLNDRKIVVDWDPDYL